MRRDGSSTATTGLCEIWCKPPLTRWCGWICCAARGHAANASSHDHSRRDTARVVERQPGTDHGHVPAGRAREHRRVVVERITMSTHDATQRRPSTRPTPISTSSGSARMTTPNGFSPAPSTSRRVESASLSNDETVASSRWFRVQVDELLGVVADTRRLHRGVRRQNSLPSGSAMTTQSTVPWPMSMWVAPRESRRSTSAR